MPDIKDSMLIAGAGMRSQSERLRVIAENIANADSLPTAPGADPYRRKTVFFKNELDKHTGVAKVKVDRIGVDPSPFPKDYSPGHPAADAQGYVQRPNVNTIIETADQKEALRSYEANLNTIEITKAMISRTLELLR